MKVCTKCKLELDVSEFTKDKSRKDGLRDSCKKCKKNYDIENKDKQKEYRDSRVDLVKDYKKTYDENNREKNAVYRKGYREKNKQSLKIKAKIYSQTEAGKARQIRSVKKQKTTNYGQSRCKANDCVRNAVRGGKIIKPSNCEHCGSPAKVEAHHFSYQENCHLIVTWLCKKCHVRIHKELKNIGYKIPY